jgi:GH15 family glucan-1,4-alpha-glucosidase
MNEPGPTSIGDYAAIGDCRTLALVSRFGSIDWCCIPDFASASVFGALLDRERGGRFALVPRGIVKAVQHYLPHTNVLLTRIECASGVLEITDFMTLPSSADQPQEIVRIATCVAGSIEIDARFEPRPDYSRQPARLSGGNGRCTFAAPGVQCELRTSIPMPGDESGLAAAVSLKQGESHSAIFTVSSAQPVSCALDVDIAARQQLDETMRGWQAWCSQCAYEGDHAEAVRRSALALKLLTHQPTGGLVAAGTTSIPESQTGKRNWDYRFCWLRDSSLVFDAFTELGYERESSAFLNWLLHATHHTRPRLQVMYDVYGGPDLTERVLPQLRGYQGIGPVLVGNAASNRQQNDVYGEVIVTASDWVQRGGRLDDAENQLVADFAQMACKVWREPDHGIWEIRTAPRHNTHSKMMCWAAMDRALRIHQSQPLPIDAAALARERDAIRGDIEAHGWSDARRSYVGFYGGDAPDASLLLMPRMGYIDARDPRMLATTDRIRQELAVDGLLYRYPPGERYDGVEGPEHLFAICSFWCVDCLARQGRIDDAQRLYEKLLALRTPAGLYAEEFDVKSRAPVGNFPQAFSHVGSITAALTLQRRKG